MVVSVVNSSLVDAPQCAQGDAPSGIVRPQFSQCIGVYRFALVFREKVCLLCRKKKSEKLIYLIKCQMLYRDNRALPIRSGGHAGTLREIDGDTVLRFAQGRRNISFWRPGFLGTYPTEPLGLTLASWGEAQLFRAFFCPRRPAINVMFVLDARSTSRPESLHRAGRPGPAP